MLEFAPVWGGCFRFSTDVWGFLFLIPHSWIRLCPWWQNKYKNIRDVNSWCKYFVDGGRGISVVEWYCENVWFFEVVWFVWLWICDYVNFVRISIQGRGSTYTMGRPSVDAVLVRTSKLYRCSCVEVDSVWVQIVLMGRVPNSHTRFIYFIYFFN